MSSGGGLWVVPAAFVVDRAALETDGEDADPVVGELPQRLVVGLPRARS